MRSPMLVDSAKATTAVLAAIVAAPLLGVVLPGTFAYVFWLSVLATLAGVAWVLLRARERGQWPRWTAVALVLVPVLIGTADVVRTVVLYRGVVLPFMRNDMVMNTIEAMTIHNNGSLGSGAEVKPVFLTAAIASVFYGPGTGYPDLRTMIVGNIAAATATCALISVLVGSFAHVMLQGTARPLRVVGVLAVGWVPYTGLVMGQVVQFGYMNIPVIVLIMVVAWILYRYLSPWQAMVWLPLVVVVSLAAWSPAALLPGLLLLARAIRAGIGLWGPGEKVVPTRAEVIATAATWLLAAAYTLGIALPALRRDGGYLAAGPGAFIPVVTDSLIFSATALLLLVGLYGALARFGADIAPVGGLALLAVGAWAGVVYLLLLRAPGDYRWGYYPMKLMVISIAVIGVLLTIEAMGAAVAYGPRAALLRGASYALAVAALAASVVTPGLHAGWRHYLVPLHEPDEWIPATSQTDHEAYADLVRVFDEHKGGAVVFIRDSERVSVDADRNRFLIQFSAPTDYDVRINAYADWDEEYYDTILCPLLDAWDKDAVVVTSERNRESVEHEVQQCRPKHDVTVTVLD